jgi:serine/threonine protein kinase
VELLLAFKYNDHYYLVFEWAEANLMEHWERVPSINLCSAANRLKRTRWIAKQSYGLAVGLLHIQGPSVRLFDNKGDWPGVRHGDIKPENILWFPAATDDKDGLGRLVLSDFGVTDLCSEDIKVVSPTYRSPELDLHEEAILGIYQDIWALGCVFLEFVSWFVLGFQATMIDFTDERLLDDQSWSVNGEEFDFIEDKFFNLNGDSKSPAVLKVSVKKVCHSQSCRKGLSANSIVSRNSGLSESVKTRTALRFSTNSST